MKTVLYIAISLNGKIARMNGAVDWLDKIPNPENLDYGYNTFLSTIDFTIQGNNTYKQLMGWGIEFPYKNKKNYVLTNNVNEKDNEYVSFIKDHHVQFIKDLKTIEGGVMWVIGGSQVNTLMLNNNLLDELRVFIMPIILPSGIDLFHQYPVESSLEFLEEKQYSTGVIEICYNIRNLQL